MEDSPELSHSKGLLTEVVDISSSSPVLKRSSSCAAAPQKTTEQIPDPEASEPLRPSTLAREAHDGLDDAKILKGDQMVKPKSDDGVTYNEHTDAVLSVSDQEEPTKAKGIVDQTADQHDIIREGSGILLHSKIKTMAPSTSASPVDMVDAGKVDAALSNDIEPHAFPQEDVTQMEATDAQDDKEAKTEQHQPTVLTGTPMPCEDFVHQDELEVADQPELSDKHSPIPVSENIYLRIMPKNASVPVTDTAVTNTALDEDENLAPKEANVMKGTERRTTSGGSIDSDKKKGEEKEEEGIVFGGDEETVTETPKGTPPVRKVPPHMRPMPKPANPQHSNTQDRMREWPVPVPRIPRAYCPPGGYQPSRPPLDYDEIQRTKAQLMKARNDLENERKANAETQKTVGAEKQAIIGAAMSNMLTDLLHKQAEALAEKAKTQEKERELQYRERKITQLESFLSDGQRQLKYELEQQGIRPMSVIEKANLRHEIELNVRHQLSDIQGRIAIQVERLRHQEAAQKIREQQYRVSIRDAVEAEVRAQIGRDEQVRAADAKTAELACERGLAESKRSADANTSGVALRQDFLKGYAACFRSQTALYRMRTGRIATDSPELAFLYDPTHPENIHNVGVQIGRMEDTPEKTEDNAMGAAICHKSTKEAATQAVATHRDHDQVDLSNSGPVHSSQTVNHTEKAHETQRSKPLQEMQKEQQEQSVRSGSFPQRSTFAGELRSSSAATSRAAFASRFDAQSIPNGPHATETAAGNIATRTRWTGSAEEGVCAERRTVRYEESSDVEPASPNLIDLY
ncbi:hypothetical protein EKO04_006937 [Ascochyta lentis]|uniref:Uncharacterized protein n=1 Tax=Ascochyta lentis TaxID=205686 RepID=A0A8H7MHV4_9PLEO|nr:hypothetical protein EKO04_006937 [Ascochyta lentis]